MNLRWSPSIEIGVIGAKGRDFELKVVLQDDNDAKTRAYRVSAREHMLHLLRARIRRDIEIFRRQTTHHIAHTATSEIGDVPAFAQPRADFPGRLFHRSVHSPHCSGGRWPSLSNGREARPPRIAARALHPLACRLAQGTGPYGFSVALSAEVRLSRSE